MMGIRTILAVLAALALAAAPAAAEDYNYALTGSGSFLVNGAAYSGTFLSGLTGVWYLSVDDSLWPDAADTTARFDYIWETFFAGNYDDTPGSEAWFGYFYAEPLPAAPAFGFDTVAPGGIVGGSASLTIMLRDDDADGVLSQSEKHGNCQLTATLAVDPDQGTGVFEDICGYGAATSGNFRFVNPPGTNEIMIFGDLHTYECEQPVESHAWGWIKGLFR
jgi:hypothetical protein